MRSLFFVLLFGVGVAHAAPFAVADVPAAACGKCVWGGTSLPPTVNDVVVDTVNGNPAYGNRVCKIDLSTVPVGANNVTVACRDQTGIWGDSAAVPLDFVRPDLKPGVIRLVP